MTTVLTTHYLDEAQRLCDRIAVVNAGSIVALGTPRSLVGGLGDELLEIRVDGDAVAAYRLLQSRHLAGADAFALGSTITIPLHEQSASRVRALVEQLLPTAVITARPPTLDDVYLQLTGDALVA
jgi:ABC-2 type transport system ATP-binding protein